MKLIKKFTYLLVVISMGCFWACVEELPIETFEIEEDERALVIEAILTDEVKRQEVLLSRIDTRLDLVTDTTYTPYITPGIRPKDTINVETGAEIVITDSNNNQFTFSEVQNGTYVSNQEFGLSTNSTYTMNIRTRNGAEYVSDILQLQGESQIANVYAERTTSELGVEGIAIYVDSAPVSGNAKYYRFGYEETYKIIAPLWDEDEFVLSNYDPCALPVPTYDLEIVPRTVENRVCYNTVASNTIELFNAKTNANASVEKQLVRFIGKENFIISHRYSILVKQYIQSADAFSYFEALKSFAESESLFSQVQPGALYANVSRVNGSQEPVYGYIDAVSVSQERLFFNYDDFFPGEELPDYPFNCGLFSAPESHVSYCFTGETMNTCPPSVIESVDQEIITYYGPNEEGVAVTASCPGPYVFTPRICGDCTLLGENVVPDFWIE
ncbi:hypothetical protein GCM10011414_14890 [Croceivirga lutea]|uniref:DUF4249 domain-containing protein n=1 Tax=Croceivirga lutea TaxID=1775167 RepID=UPI001639F535|nr:DUF4249 domain-containing protein [Croceivirga lutea]GGG46280.1 hypothetical protein GCM10011414_14890 [Croceivirga lutea]